MTKRIDINEGHRVCNVTMDSLGELHSILLGGMSDDYDYMMEALGRARKAISEARLVLPVIMNEIEENRRLSDPKGTETPPKR
jgi:hypothetical protein